MFRIMQRVASQKKYTVE